MSTPLEIRVAAGVVGLGALVFVAVGLSREDLRFPVATGIVAVAVCVGLLVRLRFVRTVTVVVTALLAVVHLLIVLSDGPWWVRLVSGVLAAGYVYVVVLVNTEPARHYLETK